jgi:hypothetical protein
MGTVRITERFAFTGGKVDRTDPNRPVIRDVLLCGRESKNRRRYKGECFGAAGTKRYEGRHIFLNHGRANAEREYQERIAVVANERRDASGRPIGDIPVNPKHPYAEAFLWDAEHAPNSIGMSHVADCRTTRGADGWDEVEEVLSVESVDVVLGPATTNGLYESTRRSAVPQIKFRESLTRLRPAIESKDAAAGKRLRKFLLEAEDDADMAPLMDTPVDEPPAEGGDPDDALLQGFKSAIDAAWAKYTDDKDAGACLKAIQKYVKAHAKLCAADGAADSPAPEPDGDEGAAAEESKKRPKTYAGFIAEAKGYGLAKPDADDITVLEGIPTQAGRRAYCERIAAKLREAETPRSSGRQPGPGPLPGKAGDGKTTKTIESVPATGAGFAALLKG